MNTAQRDPNKVPSILGVYEGQTKAIQATEDGALKVSISKDSDTGNPSGKLKVKRVVSIDLSTSRDKELYDISFKEITIPVIEGSFTLFLDEATIDRGMTINRGLSLETEGNRFYVSNGSGKGKAEIWIWE